jgi:signal transduction histidine kinase
MQRNPAASSGMTIQRQLVRLVAATVLPAGIAAALLISYSYERQRTIVEERTVQTARALMQAVDLELASGQASLHALATSPYLLATNFAAFHQQARDAIGGLPGDNLVLTDASGQQILNTLRPFGDPLPLHGNPAQVRRVFETGRPVISDLFTGAVTRRPLIAIDVPVRRGGQVVFDLSMGFFPERLGAILTRQKPPGDWVVSIFDSKGTIVARTHDPGKYVGQKGAPGLVRRMGEVREGRLEVDTLEGIPVVAVFSRSAVSDWSVAIGIPRATLAGYSWTPIVWIIAGTVALLVLGITLAQKIGARITRAIRGLVAPAAALGRGARVVIQPLGVAEADEVGRELARAAEILRDRERVLATVSHDLRSPLGGIMLNAAYAERLAARLPGGEAIHARVGVLTDIAQRMSGMVDDLLSVAASAGGGRSMLKIVPTNAASLLAQAAELARPLLERERIKVQIDVRGRLPDILADPARILRVFANLFDNALKFTPRGGSVILRAETQPGAVQFSLSNSGPALSANELDRMFEPFWQSGREDSRGAGLGMSICRSIIEGHGGTIKALPEPGKRVSICFWLPLAAPAGTAVPGPGAPREALPSTAEQ